MDKYELVRDIGSGNFGVARLMRHKETKELVAMKYIPRGHKVIVCCLILQKSLALIFYWHRFVFRSMRMWRERSSTTGRFGIPTLSGSKRRESLDFGGFWVKFGVVCVIFLLFDFTQKRPQIQTFSPLWIFLVFAGCFDADASGDCDGVCRRRRALWTYLQSWKIQRGRGSFFFAFQPLKVTFFYRQSPLIL